MREPCCRIRVFRKMTGELSTNLVTARPDTRPDRGNDVFRASAVAGRQCPDGCDRCAGGSALPACMDGRHSSGTTVRKENRHAVRGANADSDCRIVGDRDVSLRVRRIVPACLEHARTVHLPHPCYRSRLHAERLCEFSPACETVSPRRFQVEPACAEAVPRNFRQRTGLERGSPRLLHPFEVTARLWKRHVYKYYRHRSRCHGN